MKKIISFILGAALTSVLFGTTLLAADKDSNGGLISLRGQNQLAADNKSEGMKKLKKKQDPISRQYLQQPPLIPHEVDKYKVNLKSNKCLSCHGWKNYRKEKATKIGLSHFKTRDGKQLASVSPSRYFCSQCHAPQTETGELVENVFTPVGVLD